MIKRYLFYRGLGYRIGSWCVLAIIVAAFLAGCSGSSHTETNTIWGEAYLDGPIDGADIKVLNSSGLEITRAKAVTNSNGTFMFKAPISSGESFRMILTGGTIATRPDTNEPFEGQLVYDGSGYIPGMYIYMNPLSAMVSSYVNKHKDLSPEHAETAIKKFIQLSDDIDIMGNIRYLGPEFSSFTFMHNVRTSGMDFNSYVDDLLIRLDGGETKPFRAPPQGADPGISYDIFKAVSRWTIKNLVADEDIQKFQEHPVGSLLTEMGFLPADINGNPDNGRIDEIFGKLKAIESTLVEMNGKLDQILTVTSNLKKWMEDLEKELKLATYGAALWPFISDINTRYKQYAELLRVIVGELATDTNDPQKKLTRLKNIKELESAIKTLVANIDREVKLDTIHGFLTGNEVLPDGYLLMRFKDYYQKTVEKIDLKGKESDYMDFAYRRMRDLFAYMLIVQQKGLTLITEKDNYLTPSLPEFALEKIETHKSNMLEQTAIFAEAVEWVEMIGYDFPELVFNDEFKPYTPLAPRSEAYELINLALMKERVFTIDVFPLFWHDWLRPKGSDYPTISIKRMMLGGSGQIFTANAQIVPHSSETPTFSTNSGKSKIFKEWRATGSGVYTNHQYRLRYTFDTVSEGTYQILQSAPTQDYPCEPINLGGRGEMHCFVPPRMLDWETELSDESTHPLVVMRQMY